MKFCHFLLVVAKWMKITWIFAKGRVVDEIFVNFCRLVDNE